MARSDQDYSYKTDFKFWRKKQEFERQTISMSRLPLESNPFGTDTTNRTTSPTESIPSKKKRHIPPHEHDQRNREHDQQSLQHDQRIHQSKKEKRTYQQTRIQTHHFQTHH